MSDEVLIQGLQCDACIGVHDWERNIRQSIEIDLRLPFDCTAAAVSDDLADALDYFALSEKVMSLIENSQYQLIEALAEAICQCIFDHFAIDQVHLTLRKPNAVKWAQSVGLTISRRRQHG